MFDSRVLFVRSVAFPLPSLCVSHVMACVFGGYRVFASSGLEAALVALTAPDVTGVTMS